MGILFTGAIVERRDPIRLTQTDPVALKEKVKEEEEGKKGPPAPTLRLFPRERFLAEGPVEQAEVSEEILPADEEAELGFWFEGEELIGETEETGEAEEVEAPEGVKEEKKTDDSLQESVSPEGYWWEEEGADSLTSPSPQG
jgi:hypothetical protein